MVALARCLDKEAFCEMKVDQIMKTVASKRSTFGRTNKVVQMPTFDAQDIDNLSPANRHGKNNGNYNIVA